MIDAVPSAVASFRDDYRAQEIGPRYRGWLHFGFTTTGALAAIVSAIVAVDAPSVLELLTVPISFLVANVGEYFGHRGPMHHRRRGLALLHLRHTLQHHRFFTDQAMQCESTRDFKMVLFPPVMLIFFLGLLATPIGALLWLALGKNVGALFVATAVGYFLTYEWLHFAYHQPQDGFIGRLPFVARLRRLHTLHHDPRSMTLHNFNITFPICDRLFGTYRE
jgi:sterol desaturase/sphingolipid hydroxylase (fatty acid hydroxylase superfamily)